MTTLEFLELLRQHPNRKLEFEYQPGKKVREDFHITEVKNIAIEAVDCGGRSDSWKETVIQLWEPGQQPDPEHRLSTTKALGIINKVNSIKPLQLDATVKFEYGNPSFHTAHLPVLEHQLLDGELRFYLHPDTTQCKASDVCGVPETVSTTENETCSPGSGCC